MLTPAQTAHLTFSTERDVTCAFYRPDQRPKCEASDLVSFGGSEEDLRNDSMTLPDLDAEDWAGSVDDHAPLPSKELSDATAGLDAELIRVLSKAFEELGLNQAAPEEPTSSRLDKWFLPGHQKPLVSNLHVLP